MDFESFPIGFGGFLGSSGLPLAPWIPLALPWSSPDLETNKKLPHKVEIMAFF